MTTGRDWAKARRNPNGYEQAAPRKPEVKRSGGHVNPGKARTWADMTPAEREDILKHLKGGGA